MSQQVPIRKDRVWLALGAVALSGLIALALLMSLAGSPLARLAWAGVLAVLAGMALFTSNVRWLLGRASKAVRRVTPALSLDFPGSKISPGRWLFILAVAE